MHSIGTISVILPTFRERHSIRASVEDFLATGIVDEIIVVDNNAEQGTREALAGMPVKIILEPRQGYGWAIQAGCAAALSDWIALCEPDGTFLPRDIVKLAAYAQDCDYVIGTRTSPVLVWHGANMRGLLRWGNWAVAKTVELLYNAPILTDVGCTFRLFRRKIYSTMNKNLVGKGGSDFGLVFTLLVLRHHVSLIEIPVNYRPRVGSSSVTGHFLKAVVLGFRMIIQAFYFRFIWRRRTNDS
jgi:Glycosyltransferases involved in cell wall biogenesis